KLYCTRAQYKLLAFSSHKHEVQKSIIKTLKHTTPKGLNVKRSNERSEIIAPGGNLGLPKNKS
ncbi:MAG: hypothetical protein DRR16_03030, partial [Candidatus Parabeggiatoa sp. nov. 3]